ncbi:MAG: Flp pilus assembly complex ATPase component TadA [Verrucomicrobia bacterium]|nr:Flp pilus assembly complex ATPase component TadA [Verrucomicrobiota bacterium]
MNSDSAPRVLEEIIQRAECAGASDVHLQMASDGAQVSFRLDGVLTPANKIERDLAERVFGRIKFLSHLKTYQESLPQDGRIDKADAQSKCDIRVSTYPTVTGEKIVLRLFAEQTVQKIEELELPLTAENELKTFLRQTSGMLLLTGPAGSGKTTTIYACLRHLSEVGGRHIITIEDPVEQIIPGIMQTEINEVRGLNFATAARHLLRQDPQVLVIGEIRDDETANLAVRAALTGHLVISTLHAGSCKGVFERLFVMCPDRYATISGVELVLNQRLIRRLCEKCHGVGCPDCLQTGFRGRIPVVESVKLNDSLRAELRNKGPEIIQPAPTLIEAAKVLCDSRKTNASEVERLLGSGF